MRFRPLTAIARRKKGFSFLWRPIPALASFNLGAAERRAESFIYARATDSEEPPPRTRIHETITTTDVREGGRSRAAGAAGWLSCLTLSHSCHDDGFGSAFHSFLFPSYLPYFSRQQNEQISKVQISVRRCQGPITLEDSTLCL